MSVFLEHFHSLPLNINLQFKRTTVISCDMVPLMRAHHSIPTEAHNEPINPITPDQYTDRQAHIKDTPCTVVLAKA